nr:reverse transcriptase domain-containing protein [Tanacetum cinerariifolium]
GSGTLPGNTITNHKEDLKGITTRSGVAYQGPTIPTSSKVAKQGTEVTKDQVQTPSSQSIAHVQPPVAQSETPVSEPVVVPVSAPMPNLKPSIPYPSRRDNERRRDQANEQTEKLYEIFKDMSFEISFTDALILMPKFASTLKALIGNKEKLNEMARTLMNEHYSAVILNKLPRKLRDPGKFLIPCEFPGMDECLALADLGASINLMPLSVPTPSDDPIVSTTSPTLTSFGDSDFLFFEEADAFLGLEDDPDSPELDPSYYDPEEGILLHEAILNSKPSPPLPNHEQFVSSFKKELKACDNKLLVIIAKELGEEEKSALIKVLKSHKRAIAWKLSDIHGIDPEFCTHKILMEEDYKPAVQHQRRVNPKIHDVIKKEVEKLLDAGLIYPISDSPWVSPVHCVPKKGGFTIVENEENKLIPTRLVTRWPEKTTFTCPYGTFTYRRMPFGLCNAPGTFQRLMNSHCQKKFPLLEEVPTARVILPLLVKKCSHCVLIILEDLYLRIFNKWYQSLERNFDLRRISFKSHFTFIIQFTKMDHQYPTVAKIPVLDTGKFKQWQFQIQQYLQHEHYALWEVIEFGDSYKVPTNIDPDDTTRRRDDEQSGRTITITAKDMQRKKNDVKARTTLLLSHPDEHHGNEDGNIACVVFDNSLCLNDSVAQLEGRLTEYKEKEVKYIEKIRTLEMYRASNLKIIKALDKELEEVKEGVGYNAVPPPAADLYLSPKKDLSWTGLPEFVEDTATDYSRPSPTIARTSTEGQIKDSSTSEDVGSPNPPKPFVKFVNPKDSQYESKTKEQEAPKKSQVKYAEQYRHSNKKPKGNQRNWNNSKSYQLGSEFVLHKKPCFNCGDFSHLTNDCRRKGSSQNNIDDKGYWDIGCSRKYTILAVCQIVHYASSLSFLTAVYLIRKRFVSSGFLKTFSHSDLGNKPLPIAFLGSGLLFLLHSGLPSLSSSGLTSNFSIKMANLSEDIQCAGSDTQPPMLDRTDFVSWQQRIRLYC